MSDDRANAPVYFAVNKSGVIDAVTVAEGNAAWMADVTKTVNKWMKSGAVIERGTVDEARQFLFCPLTDLMAHRSKRSS